MDVERAMHHAATLPSPGTLVAGKYHLERYIAEGGMGVIALGRHVELDEPVALKFSEARDRLGRSTGRSPPLRP